MYIQQLYTNCLAHAAYYIENGGEAAVIDPLRDHKTYLDLAHSRGAKIRYVFETHFHADFVSGHIDLANKTGAEIIFGPGAEAGYKIRVAEDGELLPLGKAGIKVLHTPGHTVESSCFLLLDETGREVAVFTGDTLFVNEVGRPDLLSGNKSKEELAAMLFDSLNNKLKTLPGNVIVYPGHGPGSACGKNIGAAKFSTIAEEVAHNYALLETDKDRFIQSVTSDLPTPPGYFFKDAAINKNGVSALDDVIARTLPGGGSYSYLPHATGNAQRSPLGNVAETRLIIGGTHFWGHADLFIAVPVYAVGNGTRTGPETGARIYPWPITNNRIRPYGAISAAQVSYSQGDGPLSMKMRTPLGAGITYCSGRHLLDVGVSWFYRNDIRYYVSPLEPVKVQQQNMAISIGYKWMMETTASAEKNWQNGITKAITDTLAQRKRLNGLTLAVGPSAAFYTRSSSYNRSMPYLGQHKSARIYADVGAGYYWHRPDIQANIAWRKYGSEIAAYGATQNTTRRSLAMECYKFLGDYHGFVPFAGTALSHEKLAVSETTTTGVNKQEVQIVRPGFTFGWDIRPDRLQVFYLRTNIRYFPRLGVPMGTKGEVAMDALEVNFIQLVIFPGRIVRLRK